jgi:hypothetical protein
MTKQVVVIKANGEVSAEQVANENEYQFLSETLEGWLQAVPLDDDLAGLTLWVNEEGKMNGLAYNQKATYIWEKSYGFTDVIVGNAVITGGTDFDGETISLTDEQVLAIVGMLN